MSCVSLGRIAAAASGEDAAAELHAESCARCGALLAEQREIAAMKLPIAPLPSRRRAEMAAELAALADVPARRRMLWPLAGAAAVVLVAAAVWTSAERRPAPVVEVAVPDEEVAVSTRGSAHDGAAPSATHAIDAIGEGFDAARMVIAMRTSAIAQIFANTGREHVVKPTLARDEWTAPTNPSVEAFRIGWEALRAGKHADAIEAFDRATDEAVLEDAMFWAAVAAERRGDHDAAKQRMQRFLDRFPKSPRADTARAMLR